MTSYAPLDNTYSYSPAVLRANPTLATQVLRFFSDARPIEPTADYQVGVHPNPFTYFALQHGVQGTQGYFPIMQAYNGVCSTTAIRPCAGDLPGQTSYPQ